MVNYYLCPNCDYEFASFEEIEKCPECGCILNITIAPWY